MKKSVVYVSIALVVLILGSLIFFRYDLPLATVSERTFTEYGGVMLCGNYYSSKLYDYESFAGFCEDLGYECFLDNWVSPVDGQTIYEVSCQEYCYDCYDGEEYILAVAPSCASDGYEEMPAEDVQTYFDNPNPYNPGGSLDFGYCGTSPVKCYECTSSGSISSYTEDSGVCPSGWTENEDSLDCSSDSITCYQCSDGDIVSNTFDGSSCGTGWYSTQPDCGSDVLCYTCQDEVAVAKLFSGSCELPYTSIVPDCKNTQNYVDCYICQDGVVQGAEFANSCPAGYDEVPVSGLSADFCQKGINILKDIIDFENKPGQSIAIIALAVILVGLLISAFSKRGNQSSGGLKL